MESRSQFTDTSKFLGSVYYFDQLGLDGAVILADIDRLSRVVNPNAENSRILGDSFVESTLILKELKSLTNDSLLLSEDVVDDEEQVKELLDNAVSEFDSLGIDASDVAVNGLTQEQIDSLSKDIVTFETVEVNGLTVLAPKIYLSLATRERLFGDASGDGESEGSLADGSVMFGKESFVIDAANADFINNGTIRTGSTVDASGTSLGGNLTLNVASLTNRTNSIARARIISGNDLAITANDGDIKNLGGSISATANLTLSTVNGSVINSAIVQTNDANLLSQNVGLVGEANTDLGDTPYQLAQGDYARSGGNITSTLLHNASMTGGSITINAANDFTNLAASMVTNQNLLADASTTSGDLAITAGDDITIDTLQLRNRSERRWGNSKKGGIEIKDYTSNIGSGISSAGNVSLITDASNVEISSDINIIGSEIKALQDINLISAGNVVIANAVDSSYDAVSSWKKGSTRKSNSSSVDYVETAVSSGLSADNINISSLGDTLIQASDIDTNSNLIIGSFTIAQNEDGSYQKDSNGNYVTTSSTTVDNLTIRDVELNEYHYAQNSRGYTGIAAVGMRALPYVLMPVQIASSYLKSQMSILLPDSLERAVMDYTPEGLTMKGIDDLGDEIGDININESYVSRVDKTNSFASNLNVDGSMMTNSVGDTLIKGSDVTIQGDLLANAIGDFRIEASQNTEKTTSKEEYETAGKFHSDMDVGRVKFKAGTTKEFVDQGGSEITTSLVQSNVNVGGSALINTSEEFALLASNLITAGSSDIRAKGDLNISDMQNTQSSSEYLDKLTIDTGIQVGNSFADAGHAIIDAVKAQKAVKDAYDKLGRIKDLKKQDMASSKAVERAEYQVVLALVNAGLSSFAAMQAVKGAAATTSTAGFYGSVYADITKLKSTTTSEYSQSIASNLSSGNSVNLNSGNGDINIVGSNVTSTNGDLNLTAMLGNLNISAGESTTSQSYKMNSQSLGGSVGNNGVSLNVGFNQAETTYDTTTFNNSQLLAENGDININTGQDANIIGANLLASNVNLDIGNNLTIKSKQNLLEYDSYNTGLSLGTSSGPNGASGKSVGFSLGNGYQNRSWVDGITTITGTNSVTINTGNNTNIIGAAIANQDADGNDLGNLTLNTKSLTFSDLNNFSVSESNQFSANLSTGKNPNNPTASGSLDLNLSMQGDESSSTTKATIGQGTININSIEIAANSTELEGLNRDINNAETNKRKVITSDFDAELSIDLRLLAAAGNLITGDTEAAGDNWDSYVGDAKEGWDISFGDEGLIGTSNKIKKETTISNDNGDVVKEGHFPSLMPGLFMSKSKTGKGFYYDADGEVYREKMGSEINLISDPLVGIDGKTKPSGIINQYDSNPALAALWHIIPGFKSFTQYHDLSVDEGRIASEDKTSSIGPYLLKNTAGAVGTLINPSFYREIYQDLKSVTTNNNIGENNE